jgi:hypothetical protein
LPVVYAPSGKIQPAFQLTETMLKRYFRPKKIHKSIPGLDLFQEFTAEAHGVPVSQPDNPLFPRYSKFQSVWCSGYWLHRAHQRANSLAAIFLLLGGFSPPR